METIKYITVEKAVETLCRENGNWSPNYFTALLNKTPAEDVTPVVHAHWEIKEVFEEEHHICSNCRSRCPSVMTVMSTVDHPYGEEEEIDIDEIDYCPYCGAKMDEELNNENH